MKIALLLLIFLQESSRGTVNASRVNDVEATIVADCSQSDHTFTSVICDVDVAGEKRNIEFECGVANKVSISKLPSMVSFNACKVFKESTWSNFLKSFATSSGSGVIGFFTSAFDFAHTAKGGVEIKLNVADIEASARYKLYKKAEQYCSFAMIFVWNVMTNVGVTKQSNKRNGALWALFVWFIRPLSHYLFKSFSRAPFVLTLIFWICQFYFFLCDHFQWSFGSLSEQMRNKIVKWL